MGWGCKRGGHEAHANLPAAGRDARLAKEKDFWIRSDSRVWFFSILHLGDFAALRDISLNRIQGESATTRLILPWFRFTLE